jgi:hypothetical protein
MVLESINYAASESTKQKVFWWVLWVITFQMGKKMLCTLLCFLIAVMDQLLTKTKRVLLL